MFCKGDLVRHGSMPSWGIGKVEKTVQGGNLLIRFDRGGKRLVHPGYAPLNKVPEDDLLYLVVREVRLKRGRSVKSTRIIPVLKRGRY